MHETTYTIDAGHEPSPDKTNATLSIPSSDTTAPRDWLGTPMEMVADVFGMKSPWRNDQANRAAHRSKVQARRDRRNKLAKQARRRNRR